MTEQESTHIYNAIITLSDAAETITGTDRARLVTIMQQLSDMYTGEAGKWNIETWLAELAVEGATSGASRALTH
jgi:hypothetical protein